MNPELDAAKIMLLVIAPKNQALHIASSKICTKASFRLKLSDPPSCKTRNIYSSFVDHTVKNRFYNNFGFGPQLRNASSKMLVCGKVPLNLK